MTTRRDFLKTASLLGFGATVPAFLARTAQAAAPGKDNILVVLEMTGGNDGLNTVIPYADDLYHKARPTLRQTKDDGHPPGRPRRPALRHAGLPADVGAGAVGGRAGRRLPEPAAIALRGDGHLAVGRSPRGDHEPAGWAGRRSRATTARAGCRSSTSAASRLPLAVAGAPGAGRSPSTARTPSASSWAAARSRSRRPAAGCWRSWRRRPGKAGEDDLVSFVQRRQVQTLTAVEQLRELLEGPNAVPRQGGGLGQKLQLDRRPDRQGLRHAHLLRQPRRLRHPRRPGHRAQQPAGRAGRLRSAPSSRR